MKARNGQIDFSEMPPYRLGRHWNTIQTYLIPGIEDDLGELSEEVKMFIEICELLIDEKMFAKYRWCGNGRPPSSRISMFKSYILKRPMLLFFNEFQVHFSFPFRKETALYCLPMASKPMTVTVFGFFTHRFPLFVGF